MKNLEDDLVFVVDDNEMQSMMMDYVLSKENSHKVMRFSSGEECIANLEKNPDVIVLDYSLPGINGMETFKAIQKQKPNVPVFIISATNDPRLEEQFLEAGVYSYIVKESDAFHNLGMTIESLLSNSVSINEHEFSTRRRLKFILSAAVLFLLIAGGIIYYVAKMHMRLV